MIDLANDHTFQAGDVAFLGRHFEVAVDDTATNMLEATMC
jgi:hypothetical protein